MPSPIAHLTAGYVIYRVLRAREPGSLAGKEHTFKRLLAMAAAFSLLPDVDAVPGFVAGDLGAFHNQQTHSLIVGVIVALLIASSVSYRRHGGFGYWFGLALLCYESHVVMDFLTMGRGVMLFWPLSPDRYEAPVKAFYGLRWSDGWVSVRHLWTVVSEMLFSATVLGLWWAMAKSVGARSGRASRGNGRTNRTAGRKAFEETLRK